MYKCIKLDAQVRNDLRTVIYSEQFKFLCNGDPKDGSDAYKMADLVIEAINTIGSNDLTFVYMFTDFEYWTNQHHFQPWKEDWDALKDRMPKERQFSICKYGLELNFNNPNLHRQALVKTQFDDVFGAVDYQAVSSAAVLSQWFNHTIANVMAAKLNSLVKRDWNSFEESLDVKIANSGKDVQAVISCNPTDLVTGFQVGSRHDDQNLKGDVCSVDSDDKVKAKIGSYVVDPDSWLPSYKQFGGSPLEIDLGYVSPYQSEIDRLQEVCKDGDRSKKSSSYRLAIPMFKVWTCHIPLWVWILAAVILLVIVVSIVYTVFFVKLDREWQLSLTRRDAEGNRVRELNTYITAPAEIQSYRDKRPVGDWMVTFHAKKYNPLNVFKLGKTGYYDTLNKGTFLDVMDPYDPKTPLHTLSPGDEAFVCSYHKPDQIILQIRTTGNTYKIEII
jgi:hypothetical protein